MALVLGLVLLSCDCVAALWECAWPAHPNKGACCRHELFVVWVCQLAQSNSNISLLVHGERQFTWIPTKHALQSVDRRKGFVPHLKRAQSEFCKFVVECFLVCDCC
jgi:hypothetical protein